MKYQALFFLKKIKSFVCYTYAWCLSNEPRLDARQTGDQEVVGSSDAGSATFFL